MLPGEAGCLGAVADQKVATVRGGDNFEALRRGRPDDNDFVDARVSLKGVRGTDRGVAGYEQTDSHVGWTGFQSSAGSDSSLLRRMARIAAAASTMTTSGERRLTCAVYDVVRRFSIRRLTRDDW